MTKELQIFLDDDLFQKLKEKKKGRTWKEFFTKIATR